jgi:hypothetical protein
MMKKTAYCSILSVLAILFLSQCFSKTGKPSEKKPEMKLITHKEGADSIRKDTNAPIKALTLKPLKSRETYDYLKKYDLSSLFQSQYPKNGFYGEDHYRIEYILTEVKQDSLNVNIFRVKGKNRHKKVISEFEGFFRMIDMYEIQDPNINTNEYYNDDNPTKIYGSTGDFEFTEKGDSKYSGVFKGKLTTEWVNHYNPDTKESELNGFWFYSENLPSKGAGCRFDGIWTSKSGDKTTPFIWAEDIFRFGNEILADFSYGEREVIINKKYRSLGWDEYLYNEEEWWNETPKKPEM